MPTADRAPVTWLFVLGARPAWPRHVAEPVGFGDLGTEIDDGWPVFVERDVVG